MREKQRRQTYPTAFEFAAVKLAASTGIDDVAEPLGVPRATFGNRAGRRRSVPVLKAERAWQLRERANAKLDNETLRMAAAYFARDSR